MCSWAVSYWLGSPGIAQLQLRHIFPSHFTPRPHPDSGLSFLVILCALPRMKEPGRRLAWPRTPALSLHLPWSRAQLTLLDAFPCGAGAPLKQKMLVPSLSPSLTWLLRLPASLASHPFSTPPTPDALPFSVFLYQKFQALFLVPFPACSSPSCISG